MPRKKKSALSGEGLRANGGFAKIQLAYRGTKQKACHTAFSLALSSIFYLSIMGGGEEVAEWRRARGQDMQPAICGGRAKREEGERSGPQEFRACSRARVHVCVSNTRVEGGPGVLAEEREVTRKGTTLPRGECISRAGFLTREGEGRGTGAQRGGVTRSSSVSRIQFIVRPDPSSHVNQHFSRPLGCVTSLGRSFLH